MRFRLVEKIENNETTRELLEARFNYIDLAVHYDEHVRKMDEPFNENDPKFPPMSITAYGEEAERLSLEDFDPMYDLEDVKDSWTGVMGFVTKKEDRNEPTRVKIRIDSDFVPGYSDVVVYHEDETLGHDIVTFFPMVKYRIKREYRRKIESLPEVFDW